MIGFQIEFFIFLRKDTKKTNKLISHDLLLFLALTFQFNLIILLEL